MFEPFQGARIGPFTVLAPTPARYAQLVIQSDKTPSQGPIGILSGLMQAAAPLIRFIKAGWGSEKFSSEPTSVENEMSVIQYATLCGGWVRGLGANCLARVCWGVGAISGGRRARGPV